MARIPRLTIPSLTTFTPSLQAAPSETQPDRRGPVTRHAAGLAEIVDRWRGWSRVGKWPGLVVLIGLRSQLRANNLVDTGPHPGPAPKPGTAEDFAGRTVTGVYNDKTDPSMGSVGSRFGRNMRGYTKPAPDHEVLDPNPREVSVRLLNRSSGFKPVPTLNLLAAAWIQFEVHDWFNHRTATPSNPTDDWVIDRPPGDPLGDGAIRIPRTPLLDAAGPGFERTYESITSFWWDGSQIYGDNQEYSDAIRLSDGQIRLDTNGLPPASTDKLLDPNGSAPNFWVGLALMHSLFLREHNAICRRLKAAYPQMDGDRRYTVARLINCALMAKIHTVDWTPAILGHPTTVVGLRGNWFGLLGEDFARRYGHFFDNELLSGIPGSHTDFNDVPFSLTEEFVAIYRMHPLMPDGVTIRALADNSVIADRQLQELVMPDVRTRLGDAPMDDLLYSFGCAHPGALTLHNYPSALQNLSRGEDHPPIDLATIDLLRIRERGVPRYNEFRRQLRLKPKKDFTDLTKDRRLADELAAVYGDIERLDLMIGLYAEPTLPGFGFSDTAFRIFILMASRRLSCDRFLTDDFNAEVYTEVGMAWIRDNSMRSVLLRHFPTLAPALCGVANPFAPWNVQNPPKDQPS
ncbi:peroxidase family protein [Gordonia sp. CPCC 205515]|uniref:peroxidase family protein n=1 Tax=Gordonia sp. CPCC 205515 TaxID=3140791 RepID=UPI003AF39B5A